MRTLAAILALQAAEAAPSGSPHAADFGRDVRPLLAAHCFRCHDGEKRKGGVDLTLAEDDVGARRAGSVYARALAELAARRMPPATATAGAAEPGAPLDDAERDRLAAALRDVLAHPAPDEALDPGRVVLRRLSRFEFDRTVADLLGITYDSTATFPDDPLAYGFDDLGDVMSVAPLLFEKYADAARDLVDRVFADDARRAALLAPALAQGGRLDTTAARAILAPLLERAFRRPVAEAELAARVDLFAGELAAGRAAPAALATALESVLLSPDFLFRVERGADPPDRFGVRPLTGFELATRLSYFLTSTAPDAELFAAARAGRLADVDGLRSEARRLLADPRARTLADHFAAQWLRFGEVKSVAVDIRRFPLFFQLGLRDRFYEEAAGTFAALVREDRSVLELLDAPTALLDDVLAQHYGIPDVAPGPLRRVALSDRRRGGLLGMGALLTVTSYPLRTSPVLRGKWLLETLLDAPPPPPPADVPPLPKDDRQPGKLTLRQRLEEHRRAPACAGCHATIDPFGLALENYDGIGAWRGDLDGPEGPLPIDAKTTLQDGTTLDGAVALKEWLVAHGELFERTLARRLLTFAVGRPMEFLDEPLVRQIAADAAVQGHRFSAFVEGVVASRPFRYVRRD